MITVVGMGTNSGDLTLAGQKAIQTADVVVVKSALTHCKQTVASIRKDALYCDEFYATAQDFDQLNNSIANFLRSFGNKKVVFCVVGDGSDDSTVQLMADVKVVPGVSLGAQVVGNNTLTGTRVFTAQDFLLEQHVLPVPTIVKCVDEPYLASEVQLKLLQAFAPNDKLLLCDKKGKLQTITVQDLLKQNFGYQTTLYVIPTDLKARQVFDYYDCADILYVLRGENGCPWDRAQTHQSITKNVIEEAYELANALQNNDIPNIVEELGDLLMQVLFHIEIANDEGEFAPADVYTALCRKLIDRHPHVFGDVTANNAEESLNVWEKQKQKEHKIKNLTHNLVDVPQGMSALMRGQKIQHRAAKGGYDFANVQQILGKINEELDEFMSADDNSRQMEGGDLLFAVVNLLRVCGVDSETALVVSTEKFVRRVSECERILEESGRVLADLPMQEFDQVWEEAKHNVG